MVTKKFLKAKFDCTKNLDLCRIHSIFRFLVYLTCVAHFFSTLLSIGADFISAGVKLATYILCLCLIWSCKKAGRVTSSVQWLFWFFLVICQGFTFGSVVNHDLSAVHVLSSRFSGFYLDFIKILSWFYPDFILIFEKILIKLGKTLYPDFSIELSKFYPDKITIKSRQNLDKRTWTRLYSWSIMEQAK